MNEVFISYKREDEVRVGRLVQSLERAALSVWWDRGLPGGENWRRQIQDALDAARCVVVVWTHQSAGPAGDFVRDEAAHAKRRGLLVPVMLDKVDPPLGFGEIQAIDLTHWRGSSRDPFFQDLAAAVTAKVEGRAVPPSRGPMKRLIRRLTWSSLASALMFGGLAFGLDLFRMQEQVCGLPLLQPQMSDMCGGLGLGKRPTERERMAWAARQPGSCSDLRTHIERFPKGAFHDDAASLLAARKVIEKEVWTPVQHRLAIFQPQDDTFSATRAAAQAAALARAQAGAQRQCGAFAATASFRLTSATAAAQVWDCSPQGNGVTCGFEGEAVCALDERRVQEIETCGKNQGSP